MYKLKKIFYKYATRIIPFAAVVLCLSSTMAVKAETLGQRAIYNVNIVVETDPTSVGFCSSFDFGDASLTCTGVSKVTDNVDTNPLLVLSGGDGVLDGFAGVFVIETGKADALGDNTFTLNSFQMDPYLNTAGGTFKTSMTPPDAANNSTGGILTAAGGMTLDVTGRAGVAAGFVTTIGIQPWNLNDSTNPFIPATGVYEPFTTGNSVSYFPDVGGAPGGVVDIDLTGRAIGDANTDGILDAILVSAGNIGTPWLFFEGTGYSEIYNIQFVLVSADPVAVDDTVVTTQAISVVIDIANDLLVNDSHAAGEALTLDSATQPVVAGSNIVVDIPGGTITYTPDATLVGVGVDSFTYTISDVGGQTDTATVTINIATGSPPVANDDPGVVTNEDNAVTFDPVAGIDTGTVADTDPDPGQTVTLVISAFDASSPNSAAITSTGGNNLTYTPPPNFNGPDTFIYTIQDVTGFIDTATVTVTVASVNDAPVCSDVGFTTAVDTVLVINIADDLLSTTTIPALCTDAENDGLTLASFDPVGTSGGTVTSDGTRLTYTPPAGFIGNDTFTFTATDGVDFAAPQMVTVEVADPTLGNFTMLKPGDGAVFGGTNDIIFDWDGTTFNSSAVDASNIPTDTTFGIMTIVSKAEQLFFGFKWFAHHIRVFDEGTYTFDTTCTVAQYESGQTVCNGPLDTVFGQTEQFVTMTVGPGQVGAHILFDYNQSVNIDVLNVYDRDGVWDRLGATGLVNKLWDGAAGAAPDPDTSWKLVSRDVNGDGFNGNPMVDGPFIGYYANFNDTPGASAPPPPPITTTISDTSLSALGLWSLITGLLIVVFMRRKVIVK